jgi:hypothetical protein
MDLWVVVFRAIFTQRTPRLFRGLAPVGPPQNEDYNFEIELFPQADSARI